MKIGVVIVTFNRVELLKKSLLKYEGQTFKPEYIVVVNNNSTDSTFEYLQNWRMEHTGIEHIVINLEKNIGGSGGFYEGLKTAKTLNADWIWVADDDAFIYNDAFQEFVKFCEKNEKVASNCSAICAGVIGKNGIERGHRQKLGPAILGYPEFPIKEEKYKDEYINIDYYSFVGSIINKEVLEKVGLPNKDFFIYEDDFEHAIRMKKEGQIICVPSIRVYHEDNGGYTREATWRDYYATRNVLYINLKYFGKWAFFIRAIRRMLTALKSGNIEKVKVFSEGIKDARNYKLGIHEIYKPGWIPKKRY